jgi:hypothetical protein
MRRQRPEGRLILGDWTETVVQVPTAGLSGQLLKQIHTQLAVGCFLNALEPRVGRSGFGALDTFDYEPHAPSAVGKHRRTPYERPRV